MTPQSAPGEAQALPLVKIEHIYGRKVWIESDMMGARHVMVQHDAPDAEPFCYCSFHYDYAYTSNAGTLSDATRMAVALGATEPVEERHRELEFELEFDRDVIDSAMKAAARIAELEAALLTTKRELSLAEDAAAGLEAEVVAVGTRLRSLLGCGPR
jgi:hypothetical protein